MSENVKGQEGRSGGDAMGNTSGQSDQLRQQGTDAEGGSGRSYDYGSDNSLQGDAMQNTSDENSGTQRSGGEEGRAEHSENYQPGQNNATATRGGTADLNNDSVTGTSRNTTTHGGSGINTKRSVTGSDYDGQVSQQRSKSGTPAVNESEGQEPHL